MDKPGTPSSGKARSTTPNAASKTPAIPPLSAGYPSNSSPYQVPDPYRRAPPDQYGRQIPFDPHAHVRTNGLQYPAAGKP